MELPDDDFVEIPLGGDDSEKSKEGIEPDRSKLPKENAEPERSELNETILKLEAAISEFFPDDKPKSLGVINQLFVDNLQERKKLLTSILNQRIVEVHSELDKYRNARDSKDNLDKNPNWKKSADYFNVVGNIRTREDLLRRLKEKELPGVEFPVAVQPVVSASIVAVPAAVPAPRAVDAPATALPASGLVKSSILSNIADGALAVGYGLIAGPFVGGAELTSKEQKNGISWLSPVGFFSNVYHRMPSNFAAPVSGLIAAASTAVLAPLFVALIPVNMVLGFNEERKRGGLSKTVSDFLNLGRKNKTEVSSQENKVSDIVAETHARSTQTVASIPSQQASPVLSEQKHEESTRVPPFVVGFNISKETPLSGRHNAPDKTSGEVLETEKKHRM